MRWVLLVLIFFVGFGISVVVYNRVVKPQSGGAPAQVERNVTAAPAQQTTPTKTNKETFFVPYWQLDGSDIELPNIDYAGDAEKRLVYFGVGVNEQGVQQTDTGYQNLSLFLDKTPAGSSKYLGVRMTDDEQNSDILANPTAQKTIVSDVVALAKEKKFDGIVVDLELKPTLNEKAPAQINAFIESFYNASHDQNLKLAITLYGDTFYRKRPYDIAYLSKVTDEFMIMAYDLHKAAGEPGPNFPLAGRQTFGYDMQTLVSDFAGVPPDQLTFIYGMYGYDWVVSETKQPIRPAKSATLAQIRKNFIEPCASVNCVITRDKDSRENEIDFIDKSAVYHVVWHEDVESTKQKTEFLNSKGISSIGFWAYGFF